MSKSVVCPDAKTLEDFALGRMPIDEIDPLAEHLSHCEPCVHHLETVEGRDTLVDAMAKYDAACGEAPHALVQNLIARLKQANPAAKDPSGEQPTLSVHADSSQNNGEPSGEVTADQYDFLAPPEEPGELGRLGGYRVFRVLGAGGMGVVFEAEDEQLQRRVALKVMKPALAASESARKRFVREAQTTANLKNDHIVTIHQVGEDRGVPFLAMELLAGCSLADRLRKVKTLPTAQVLRLGQQIARGLSVAHAANLIHRDIKPANIWIEPEAGGRAKLLDFGLARVANDDEHLTQPGAIVGTPAYMSPEQAQSKPVDERCDIFSMGCVLYRLTTGQTPFRGSDTIATLLSVATDEPKPPHEVDADVPRVLSDYVMRLLAKNPDDRPATAKDVESELKRMATEPARPATAVAEVPRRWTGRRIAATVAVSLLSVIVSVVLLQQVIIRITGKDGKKRDIVVKPGEKVEIITEKPTVKRKLPKASEGGWPIDKLSRDSISPYELKVAGGGDPAKAPKELVAVLGDSSMKHWGGVNWA